MRKMTSALAILSLLLFPGMLFGQGVLRGVVTDSLAKSPMIGINVFLVGTGLGCATDIEGQYRIPSIPYGKHTLRVSSVGYAPKEVQVTVSSPTPIQLNFELSPTVIQGKEVVITAQMRGQVAAINQQLTSNTIVNVVSAEKIQELPDANAAAAIGRLSGVSLVRNGGEATNVVLRGLSSKFSTITIDGVRIAPTSATDRGVDLSLISQGTLSGIELMKALTADKDADAIAGAVNLVTRKAPSERRLLLDAKGNYNKLDNSANQYNVNGQYGERFFDDVLGVQVIGYAAQTIRSQESTNRTYDFTVNTYTDWKTTIFDITYQNEMRKRGGGSLLLDFNTPDNGTIRFNNVYNQTSRNYLSHNRNYPFPSGPVTYIYQNVETKLASFQSSLRGENYLAGFELNWNLAFSETKVNTPYNYLLNYFEPSSTSGGGSGMGNVPDSLKKGPVELWPAYAFNNFHAAVIDHANDDNSKNYDKERTAFVDIARKYSFGSDIIGELKFGSKYRTKSRYYSANDYYAGYYLFAVPEYVMLSDGSYVKKDFTGTRFDGMIGVQGVPMDKFLDPSPPDRNIYGMYRLFPEINKDALRLWRELNIHGVKAQSSDDKFAEYLRNDLVSGANYSLTERTFAGYLMNTLSMGTSMSVILGVRVESDNNDYTARYTPLSLSGANNAVQGFFYTATANHKETSVLPNIQAILKPTDFLNVRMACYQALARPDFSDRLPQFVARSSSGNTLTVGNPDLKNAIAWNYEVQTQLFGNNIGLFSVSAFYKNIKNMYQTLTNYPVAATESLHFVDSLQIGWQRYAPSFPFANKDFTLTWTYNSPDPTRVWGFEVEHQADLRFLPGLLKNIVLNYNFTVLRSETWVTTTIPVSVPNPPRPPKIINVKVLRKQKLQDQPEFFANASLGYDYQGFSFRVSYFYQGEYNRTFSFDQRTDGLQDAYSRWDIAIKQEVTKYLSLMVNIDNLTNTQEGRSVDNRVNG